jgi:hypothetical protein
MLSAANYSLPIKNDVVLDTQIVTVQMAQWWLERMPLCFVGVKVARMCGPSSSRVQQDRGIFPN